MYKTLYTGELKAHFGPDERRINHALKVLSFAERIMDTEGVEGEIRKIVIITALLHDVGIKTAEQKYNSAAGTYQEIEGPPVVKEIMQRHGEAEHLIERAAYIVGGHHTPAKIDGLDFAIVWDADWLVNIEEEGLADNKEKVRFIIEKNFKTAAGKQIATEIYLR